MDAALELEKKVGKDRYYKIAGARPFPGGISSSTWAWYRKNEPNRLKKADLVGHLNTFLHRQFTGARVIDTANACFMGLYSTGTFGGWNDELCRAVGADRNLLPDIHDANAVGGTLTPSAATRLGLKAGTPVLVGVVDGSCGMLLAGSRVGQLLNVCGSTDVLALCTDRFSPHPQLLTRPLGVGKLWLSVSTIASAGSAISWAKDQFFAEDDWPKFEKLAASLARQGVRPASAKRGKTSSPSAAGSAAFEPFLAGDRMSIEQRQAAFTGLTLATTRQQMLAALLESLAQASAARLILLKATGTKIRPDVIVTGGAGKLTNVFHRDWPGKWTFRQEDEATLRGLSKLEPKEFDRVKSI